jgi:hypothetical protein
MTSSADEWLFTELEARKLRIRQSVVMSWYADQPSGMIPPGMEGGTVEKSESEPEVTKVGGPHGYIHGWIKVGADSLAAHKSIKDEGSSFKRQGLKYEGATGRIKDGTGKTIGHISPGNQSVGFHEDDGSLALQPYLNPQRKVRYVSRFVSPRAESGGSKKEVRYGGEYDEADPKVPEGSQLIGIGKNMSEAKEAIARAHEARLASGN